MQAHKELKATARLAFWTFAWTGTLALATFGPRHLWDLPQQVASWAAIAVNIIAGIGWIIAITHFLRTIDELQRKIMQDALAITLGVGWVAGFAYVVADAAKVVTFDLDVAFLAILMGVVFMVAIAAGNLRYR